MTRAERLYRRLKITRREVLRRHTAQQRSAVYGAAEELVRRGLAAWADARHEHYSYRRVALVEPVAGDLSVAGGYRVRRGRVADGGDRIAWVYAVDGRMVHRVRTTDLVEAQDAALAWVEAQD